MSALKVVVGVVVVAALFVGYTRWEARPLTIPELSAKYKLPNSQFADIDGVQVHYAEDGAKDLPCVVMLQGVNTNLRIWDPIVDDLKKTFRLIRIDTLTMGLTSPDPKGDYSAGRNPHIIETMMDRLGAPRCAFVTNGGGGRIAYRIADSHPERVERIVMMNSAGAPHDPAKRPAPPNAVKAFFAPYSAFAGTTRRDYGAVPPTEAFIRQNYDMNRRAGLASEIKLAKVGAAGDDAQSYLPKVRVPVLLIWGATDVQVPIEDLAVFERSLTNAPNMTKVYKDAGHYPYLEHPKDAVRDITAFLSGAYDGELRQPAQSETPPANATVR